MHHFLCTKQRWYKRWHQNPWHFHVHMGILMVAMVMMTFSAFRLAPPARAATLTVCDSGCDHTTIQDAITAATTGDTINVTQAKTYDEPNLNFGVKNLILDGTNVVTLTDTSRTGNASVLFFNGGQTTATVVKNFTITGSASTPNNAIGSSGGAYITVENNIMQGFLGDAINFDSTGVNAVAIRDNTFQNLGGRSVYLPNSSAVIEGNTILGGGSGSEEIEAYGFTTLHIVNNVIKSHISADVDSADATVVIANNTIYHSGNNGIKLTDDTTDSFEMTATVKNNIIDGSVATTYDSFSIDQTGDNITLTSNYNLFRPAANMNVVRINNGVSTYATIGAWQSQSTYGNLTGQDVNSITGDPLFTNVGSDDFTLQNLSTAIGAGTDDIVGTNDLATYSANLDIVNNTRPLAGTLVDMGAYEHQTLGEVQSIVVVGTSSLNTDTPAAQLTATASYNVGPDQAVTSVATWNSTDTTKVAASSTGVVRGAGTGSSTISATYRGVNSNNFSVTTSGLGSFIGIYVDASAGNDSNLCIQSSPCLTLSKGNAELTGGTRILLKGSFIGSLSLTSSHSGTAANNTWITNIPNESATVNANGGDFAIHVDETDYVTIQGLTLTGATLSATDQGIHLDDNSDYITVNNNTIHGNGIGIHADLNNVNAGTNHIYSNNIIYNNQSGGLILNSNSTVDVYNNVIYENTSGASLRVGIGFLGTLDDIDIWNNTIVEHQGGGVAAYNFAGAGDPTLTNFRLKNNIIVQTDLSYNAPFQLTDAVNIATGNAYDYNLYYGANTLVVNLGVASHTSLASWRAAGTHDDHSLSSDPLFTNPATDDYTINTGSPAVNNGEKTGGPAGIVTDILGVTRNALYDMGAYETAVAAGGSSSLGQISTQSGAVDASTGISQIQGKVAVKINLGTHRDTALLRNLNQLLKGERVIVGRKLIQTRLNELFQKDHVQSVNAIKNDPRIREKILVLLDDFKELNPLLRGQSSDRLVLEVWEAGSRTSKVAHVPFKTNVFGEGSVSLPTLNVGNYDFTVKKSFGLRQSLNSIALSGNMMLDFTKRLSAGDVNGDGVINIDDFNAFAGKFKSVVKDPKDYDFNEDGDLDIEDFSELIRSWRGE